LEEVLEVRYWINYMWKVILGGDRAI